ncbi:DUF1853 family protein [Salinimicrobium xinjiangense]|uniref:DUF1853 family protein n=1 Tax=Salinimicrobium xinjiangense TaxID=438596 RepID=UPI000414EE36|nr:DUF1853 family protein [Salinimicrobium xinjiangense]
MEFTPKEQFMGFLGTSEIFAENDIFEYPLYHTASLVPGEKSYEISAPTASVLGKRMEYFFSAYISNFTSEKILTQNRQIIQNKETLGEIDFLLKDPVSEEISHVELIYKFYLYDLDTGTSELDHLIGPNKRDSLNQKLERLKIKQFPLLFHPATRELLSTLGIEPQDVVQKMCFKASVFVPKQFQQISFSKINPESIAGFWIKASEFTFKDFGQNHFFTPKKKFWPVPPKVNQTWFSFDQIVKQIEPLLHKHFAPMLWMKTPEGEHLRCFIVWW